MMRCVECKNLYSRSAMHDELVCTKCEQKFIARKRVKAENTKPDAATAIMAQPALAHTGNHMNKPKLKKQPPKVKPTTQPAPATSEDRIDLRVTNEAIAVVRRIQERLKLDTAAEAVGFALRLTDTLQKHAETGYYKMHLYNVCGDSMVMRDSVLDYKAKK